MPNQSGVFKGPKIYLRTSDFDSNIFTGKTMGNSLAFKCDTDSQHFFNNYIIYIKDTTVRMKKIKFIYYLRYHDHQ